MKKVSTKNKEMVIINIHGEYLVKQKVVVCNLNLRQSYAKLRANIARNATFEGHYSQVFAWLGS